MSATILLKAAGLYTQPNALDLQPGALTTASNVIIRRDNVIESRRGYNLYGNSFGTLTDRAKQLMTYKARILRHFASTLQFDTGTTDSDGVEQFSSFSGSYLEPQTGRRIRSIEANSNFYFTTSEGIKKIAAVTASDFTTASGFITQAGGIKALDVTTRLNVVLGNQSGFLPQDSAVAYRVVWGTTDINNNLILGTPSQRAVIYNPLINLLAQDFNSVLGALDNVADAPNTSIISNNNYVSSFGVPYNVDPVTLQAAMVNLTSAIDDDLLYANDTGSGVPLTISTGSISAGVATITFTTDPTPYFISGSKIFLSGFVVGTSGTINGAQVVSTSNSGPKTITFATTAVGTVNVTGSSINSDDFRSITIPTVPDIPATDQELVDLQTYLSSIITTLQAQFTTGTPPAINATSKTDFIDVLDITTSSTVILTITIPQDVTSNYFFQIYRSPIAQATGAEILSDAVPSDELQLVYEAFPTTAQLAAHQVVVEDITPDAFRGANLYTNATTGEGILQANDIPPLAKDINRFKNVIFYANTQTRHRFLINLLGVSNMITDFNNSIIPYILITDGVSSNTYKFVTGLAEETNITVIGTAASLAGKYFTLNSANDLNKYYVWYKTSGSGTDPMVSGRIGIEVEITTGDSTTTIASKTSDTLNVINQNFSVSSALAVISVTNVDVGGTTDATAGTSGFTINVTQQGRGEDATLKQVLLSTNPSPATAVTETSQSLIRVINKNTSEIIYAFYLSGAEDVPGKMLFEERTLSNTPFYVLGNDAATGLSFSPDISPEVSISTISIANPTVITTSSPHGLINQDKVLIVGSNSTPSVDGLYTITFISTTQFSIPVNVTVAGTLGAIHKASTAPVSENEILPNRIYYSKFEQPEAVPIVNTIDVGAKDKEILRIFPLRDSLFVFKEDGLFRISGETAPFNLALFDSSCIAISYDAIDVSNNLVYAWTTQGIQSVSEAGASIISRAIDVDILKLATSQYTNFKTATWGMGYEADNSYTVYTVVNVDDTVAEIGYRYGTLTNSWTTFDKSATCGIVNLADGRQYLGAGDTNFTERERKDFTRYDYADRELSETLSLHGYMGSSIRIANVSGIAAGDVLVQNQLLNVFDFNTLLAKLDNDPNLSPHTYITNLTANAGDDLRLDLDALINQIANDPGRLAQAGHTSPSSYTAYEAINTTGTITAITANNPTHITATAHGLQTGRIITIIGSNSTPSINSVYQVTVLDANTFTIPVSVTVPGTVGSFTVNNNSFIDIQASYNGVISLLNTDPGLGFHNYLHSTLTTVQETIITNVDINTKTLTLNLAIDYVAGPLIVFKSIKSDVIWAPQTLGDALGLKHMREATLIFQNKAFTDAIMSFSTDLLPMFIPVPFNGDGNGIFGYSGNTEGFGSKFFGGGSNSAPFRTYIPRDCQRCRYLVCEFTHQVAREQYAIYGLSLSGEISQSSRAYR